jgi:murein DD-endopeptidase MepM/ murein hydrolase activator NlpD
MILSGMRTRTVTSHRLPPPPPALRGRIVVAAVALGAFATAGAGQARQAAAEDGGDVQLANRSDGAATFDGTGGGTTSVPRILTASRKTTPDGAAEAAKLLRSQQIMTRHEAARAEHERPKFARPAVGEFTSAYGARWGRTHLGIDIAGPVGTPILAAADGVVKDAGPISGFGQWVRLVHADGTITVYGHVDSYSVRVGQRVQAGQQIARMGNRGESTGPHLHFEVWNPGGQKINPLTWLNDRGVTV